MKIINIHYIPWNIKPFDLNNKISKEVRMAISRRFDIARKDLLNTNNVCTLTEENGWVLTDDAKKLKGIEFIINPDIRGLFFVNPPLYRDINSFQLASKMRRVGDQVWDCETYAEIQEVEGIFMDPETGKISYKLI